MNPTIPNSGRLGSLAKSIGQGTNEEVLRTLFKDYKTSLKGKDLSEWVLKMIKNLENEVGNEKAIEIIEQDGRLSCGKGFKNTVKKLKNKSNNIKEFVKNLQEHYKRSSFFEYIDDNTIQGGHNKCYLLIKSAPIPIDSNLFCHFCVGHGKEFYETAIGKPVDAEIIETVMAGGKCCNFKFKL